MAAGQADPEVKHRRELRKRLGEEAVRTAIERVRGEPLSGFASRRGDWGRSMYLWAVRRYCGLTLREAGQCVGGMKHSTVDMAVRRWRELSAGDADMKRRHEKLLRLIENMNWKLEG